MNEFFWILRVFPPLRGSLGRLVGPSLGKEVDLKLCTRGGLRGTPLGLLPPLGERGGPPHNNRELPNNSKIKDFYRAIITDIRQYQNLYPYSL